MSATGIELATAWVFNRRLQERRRELIGQGNEAGVAEVESQTGVFVFS
jgi:hypothetical protein